MPGKKLSAFLSHKVLMRRFLRSFRQAYRKKDEETIRVLSSQIPPQELAPLLRDLPEEMLPIIFSDLAPEIGAEVLRHLSEEERSKAFAQIGESKALPLLLALPPDEQVDFLQSLEERERKEIMAQLPPEIAESILSLSAYPEDTAGGIMSPQFIAVEKDLSCQAAIEEIRRKASKDAIFYVYTTDRNGRLSGVLEIRKLITHDPEEKVSQIMKKDVVSVEPTLDQEEVAQIFQRYDLLALPVVNEQKKLLGVITADDVMEVIESELEEDMFKMVGSEAEELERKDPLAIARLRLPWLFITLLMEIVAGYIIHSYNETLSQIILLASFMPIISALSGNVGLQAAAIVIRGLATGHVTLVNWRKPLIREILVDLSLGVVVALALGTVAVFWSGKIPFGIVVGISMSVAMVTAGVMGTLFPIISKLLGYDPAVSAGPFASAFQDIVGFFVFLSLSTMLLHWMQ